MPFLYEFEVYITLHDDSLRRLINYWYLQSLLIFRGSWLNNPKNEVNLSKRQRIPENTVSIASTEEFHGRHKSISLQKQVELRSYI